MQNYLKFIIILVLVLVHESPAVDYYRDYNEYLMEYQRELYSKSILGFVKLYKLEEDLMKILNVITKNLQDNINMIQIYLKSIKRPKCLHYNECAKYVSNPLNMFGIIRRLHQDWPKWLKLIKSNIVNDSINNIMIEIVPKLPESDDMDEMLKNLHRVETTYAIEPKDLANGKLTKIQLNWTLTVRDCITLGNYNCKIGDYQRAAIWYNYALNQRSEPNDELYKQMLGDPLDGIHFKYAQTLLILGIQQEDPTLSIHEINNKLQNILKGVNAKNQSEMIFNKKVNTIKNMEHHLAHIAGCQGLFPPPTNLVCRYNFTTTPFLRLAPLKLEEISIDPYIVQYHDVLSNDEIEEMKRQAILANMTNGWTSLRSHNRTENENREIVARLSWLYDQSEFLQRINRRIVDMTGFDINQIKALQIATYSVGGYFMPHYDYFSDRVLDSDIIKKLGDRLASIIFYAGDVYEGGATVFPINKIAVSPKKGSSLFWYNKFDDGTPDPRSLHSVCPVVVGSRWTITKWFHQDLQMFVKPCGLQPSSVEI